MANTSPLVLPDGRRLHYLDEGSGPAVVLLHGFPLSAGMWDPQVQALADRYRLVAPDLAGFGDSDPPADPGTWTVEGYANDVAALLDHLDVAPVALVGLSMGGYVAFALLRSHPGAVSALVLADTRASADTPANRENRTAQQEWLAGGGDTSTLVDRLADVVVGKDPAGRSKALAVTRRLGEASPREGWTAALEAMKRRPDATADLGGIGVPSLVLVGEDDALTPPDVATAMQEAIPGAELAIVPGAGHLSSLENPAAFNEALGDFLTRWAK
jgi:pimeloyl-ACP methyl ester carboxylesterase